VSAHVLKPGKQSRSERHPLLVGRDEVCSTIILWFYGKGWASADAVDP